MSPWTCFRVLPAQEYNMGFMHYSDAETSSAWHLLKIPTLYTVTMNLFQGLIPFVCYNKTMDKTYAVYILTNYNETTFYIGLTGNPQKIFFVPI